MKPDLEVVDVLQHESFKVWGHGYTELFGSAGCAISRMKGHWFYLIHCFADSEKLEKQLKKLREPWEYETVVNQIFTLPLI